MKIAPAHTNPTQVMVYDTKVNNSCVQVKSVRRLAQLVTTNDGVEPITLPLNYFPIDCKNTKISIDIWKVPYLYSQFPSAYACIAR